jgi:effector-binding domain-containing protein
MQNLTSNLPFQIIDVPAIKYVFVRRWVKWTEVPPFFNDNIQRIADAVQANNAAPPQYPPSMFIHGWDDAKQESELSAAIQTNVPIRLDGGGTIQFPAGKALFTQYTGAIEQTGEIHQMLSEYIEKNNLMLGIAIEEYRTLAAHANDISKMEIAIIYRLYDGIEVPRIIA